MISLTLPLGAGPVAAQADEADPGAEVTVTSDPAPPEETVVEAPVQEQEPADDPLPPTEAPTDVPANEPSDPPTDVPTEPATTTPPEEPPATEPAATETTTANDPASTPTETATEAPSPTATPKPPVPFEPVIECIDPERADIAVAGGSEWALLDCTLRWETEDVREVQASATSREAGWSVVVVDPATVRSGAPLSAEDHRLSLADSTNGDAGFLTARLVIGTRLGCVAPLTTRIDLKLVATSTPPADDQSVTEETVTRTVEVAARSPEAPELTGMSVSFTPIANSLTGSRVSAGAVTLSFTNAPERCGWSATIVFDDFVSGGGVIPAGQLTAISADGVDGVGVSSSDGVISVVVPASDRPRNQDGTLTIATELDLGTFKPQGSYESIITVELAVVQ